MNEYHIFPSSPDASDWKPSFTVRAISDEAVKEAFPGADRIYRSVNLIGAAKQVARAEGWDLVRIA